MPQGTAQNVASGLLDDGILPQATHLSAISFWAGPPCFPIGSDTRRSGYFTISGLTANWSRFPMLLLMLFLVSTWILSSYGSISFRTPITSSLLSWSNLMVAPTTSSPEERKRTLVRGGGGGRSVAKTNLGVGGCWDKVSVSVLRSPNEHQAAPLVFWGLCRFGSFAWWTRLGNVMLPNVPKFTSPHFKVCVLRQVSDGT